MATYLQGIVAVAVVGCVVYFPVLLYECWRKERELKFWRSLASIGQEPEPEAGPGSHCMEWKDEDERGGAAPRAACRTARRMRRPRCGKRQAQAVGGG